MKKLFLGLAAAAAVLGAAEPKVIAQLCNQEEFADSPKNITIKDGLISINSKKPVYVWSLSKKSFPVEAGKTYELQWEMRRIPGREGKFPIYLGIAPFDGENKLVHAVAVNPIDKTDTELAAAVKKGDKELTVKNCSKWPAKLEWCNVVFNTKADLSDLPNNSYIRIASVAKKGENWIVTLKNPVAADYPAGTAIRVQRDGASYLYSIYTENPPSEWTKGQKSYKCPGKRENDGMRPGTKAVRFFIGTRGTPCGVEIRNYKIVER